MAWRLKIGSIGLRRCVARRWLMFACSAVSRSPISAVRSVSAAECISLNGCLLYLGAALRGRGSYERHCFTATNADLLVRALIRLEIRAVTGAASVQTYYDLGK